MSGEKPKESPVTRAELERALRHSNAMVISLRDEVLILGSQLVALTRELERRGHVSEDAVLEALPAILAETRITDEEAGASRVAIGPAGEDKYEVVPPDVPCAELLTICEARCCQLGFALNSQDLNECTVRWDYIAPYQILRRVHDRFCVHNDPASKQCQLYPQRPLPCRIFDCRNDPRIWVDFEKRQMAPKQLRVESEVSAADLAEMHRRRDADRRQAMDCEDYCLQSLRGLRDDD